jgi:hypothetical protein
MGGTSDIDRSTTPRVTGAGVGVLSDPGLRQLGDVPSLRTADRTHLRQRDDADLRIHQSLSPLEEQAPGDEPPGGLLL